MEIKRRKFLQGMLASGGVLASGSLFAALVDTPNGSQTSIITRQLWLKNGNSREAEFAVGLSLSNPDLLKQINLSTTDLAKPMELQQLMVDNSGKQLIGLMEVSQFILLQELLRSNGGKILYTGQHSWGNTLINSSRHQIVTTNQGRYLGSALSKVLISRGDTVTLNQLDLKQSGIPPQVMDFQLSNQGDWPELVGSALAQFGCANAVLHRNEKIIPTIAVTQSSPSGSLVSFVVEV